MCVEASRQVRMRVCAVFSSCLDSRVEDDTLKSDSDRHSCIQSQNASMEASEVTSSPMTKEQVSTAHHICSYIWVEDGKGG